MQSVVDLSLQAAQPFALSKADLSPWSRSVTKRIFDLALIVVCVPVLVPLLGTLAMLVFLFDGRPLFFRQVRIGRHGRPFSIYKFRTMKICGSLKSAGAATTAKSRITTLGRWLRKYKLDELPQILNVICGDMSLVGPRPKVPEQQLAVFRCRPGITGNATLAFAREERLLAHIPDQLLAEYYRLKILPIKVQLDSDYMAQATMLSDINVLFRTVTGQWAAAAICPERLNECRKPHIAAADAYSIDPST